MFRFTIARREWLAFMACMLLCAASVSGQIRPTNPMERAWLELLTRPVPGRTTCNLPLNLRFGLNDLPFDYTVALKKRGHVSLAPRGNRPRLSGGKGCPGSLSQTDRLDHPPGRKLSEHGIPPA